MRSGVPEGHWSRPKPANPSTDSQIFCTYVRSGDVAHRKRPLQFPKKMHMLRSVSSFWVSLLENGPRIDEVEEGRGSVPLLAQDPVSLPRFPNRTGGFPASGSPSRSHCHKAHSVCRFRPAVALRPCLHHLGPSFKANGRPITCRSKHRCHVGSLLD